MLCKPHQTLFHSGWSSFINSKTTDITTDFFQTCSQKRALGIIADHPDTVDISAQGCEACRNISRTAWCTAHILMRTSAQDGDGSLWTQAFNGSLDLLIKHEIADQQDLKGAEFINRLIQLEKDVFWIRIHENQSTARSPFHRQRKVLVPAEPDRE